MPGRQGTPNNPLTVVNSPEEWPEPRTYGDPYLLFHQTYDPGSGLYYWDGSKLVWLGPGFSTTPSFGDSGDVPVVGPGGELIWDKRVNWRGQYLPGATYVPDDMSRDGEWVGIANTETTDPIAPIEIGDAVWTVPDVPTWDTPDPSYTGVVYSGVVFTASRTAEIRGIRVWVPELTVNTNYRIVVAEITDPDNVLYDTIEEPVLNEDDWTVISLFNKIVFPGEVYAIYVDALNSASDTTLGPFQYTRQANSNNGAPTTGGWLRRNQNNEVRIHYVDDGSTDRSVDLAQADAGSKITIQDDADADSFVVYNVDGLTDNGTYYEYYVSIISTGPAGEPPVGALCNISLTIPIPDPTKYKMETGRYLGNANVRGYLELDGVDQNAGDDGFGVDVLVQDFETSPDWDYVATLNTYGLGARAGTDILARLNSIEAAVADQGGGVQAYYDYQINKFGTNTDIDTGSAPEAVWWRGGTITWPSAASVAAIQSNSAADTAAGTGARTIEIFGVDASFNRINETITLNGTSVVNSVNAYLFVDRMYVVTAGSSETNEGNITADVSGQECALIGAGQGQTLQAAMIVPKYIGLTPRLLGFNITVGKNNDAWARCVLKYQTDGGAIRTLQDHACPSDSPLNITLTAAAELSPGARIWWEVDEVSTNNMHVSADFTIAWFDD